MAAGNDYSTMKPLATPLASTWTKVRRATTASVFEPAPDRLVAHETRAMTGRAAWVGVDLRRFSETGKWAVEDCRAAGGPSAVQIGDIWHAGRLPEAIAINLWATN
jgi:hypothetical protein